MLQSIKSVLNRKHEIKNSDYIFIGIVTIICAVCVEIFYRQTITYGGKYSADTIVYVESAKNEAGKRAIPYIFNKLYNINESTFEIALYMGIIIAIIIILNYILIKYFLMRNNIVIESYETQFLAIITLFSGPIYVWGIHEYFYASSWSKFAWHSPTQQLMTLFGLIAVLLFVQIYDVYLESIDFKLWLGFLISALISAWAKPSFMLVFTPAVILLFFKDLVRNKKYGFLYKVKRMILLGSAAIPAGVYLLYLNKLLFIDSRGSEITVKSITEIPFSDYPVVILTGMAFPIIVYCFNIKELAKVPHNLAGLMFLMGVLEGIMFSEEGERANHGNFIWGRIFAIYFIFLTSIVLAIQNYHDRSFMKNHPYFRKMYFTALMLLLAMHVISAICYFYIIFKGGSFVV